MTTTLPQAEAFTFGMEKVPEPSVESCIVALVTALQQSKGWMRGYADSIVRNAVDRVHLGASPLDVPHHPEPHTHTWTDMEKRCILAWGNALVARKAAEKDAEIERLRALLTDASKLLKRTPPATMGRYTGRDRKSFGAQAKELVAAIDAFRARP